MAQISIFFNYFIIKNDKIRKKSVVSPKYSFDRLFIFL